MIEDLFDSEVSGRPTVTYTLMAAMLVVSGSTYFVPDLYNVFGGVGTPAYPWQVFASAFEHGWPGFPLLPHLAVSVVLMLLIGVPTEGMLGASRYLLLTLLAVTCYWITRRLTGLEFNGASVFIWAYSPIALVGLLHTSRHGGTGGPAYERLRSALVVMWVVIPLALGGLAVMRGIHPAVAVPRANVFHISAVGAGALGALAWRRHMWNRLSSGNYDRSPSDVIASTAALAVPASFVIVLALTLMGVMGH